MAEAAKVPVVNTNWEGYDPAQHPTQALLDIYTIQKEKGSLEKLKVIMIGDLKYGRTVHSLFYAMLLFHPVEYIYAPRMILSMT